MKCKTVSLKTFGRYKFNASRLTPSIDQQWIQGFKSTDVQSILKKPEAHAVARWHWLFQDYHQGHCINIYIYTRVWFPIKVWFCQQLETLLSVFRAVEEKVCLQRRHALYVMVKASQYLMSMNHRTREVLQSAFPRTRFHDFLTEILKVTNNFIAIIVRCRLCHAGWLLALKKNNL